MLKNKIAAAGMAGMLAMSLGLVACGGNNNAPAESAEASSEETAAKEVEAAEEAATALDEELGDTVYYKGTLEDGSTVNYYEDPTGETAALFIVSADLSEAKLWDGPVDSKEDGDVVKATITDSTSGETINYTVIDGASRSFQVEIDGYGEVLLLAVTQDDYEKEMEEAMKLLDEADSTAATDEAADATTDETATE